MTVKHRCPNCGCEKSQTNVDTAMLERNHRVFPDDCPPVPKEEGQTTRACKSCKRARKRKSNE